MERLLPVEEALRLVLEDIQPTGEEWVALAEADGRVLTRDVVSRRTQPPTDVSSMDGYALRAADSPGRLKLIGESAAGRPFNGRVGPGQAVRIFTGAALPEGANAVIAQEDAVCENDMLAVTSGIRPGRHVRRRGLDFAEGLVGLTCGQRLHPRAIALAAAMDHASLPVHRRPRVALLSTGDELVLPGVGANDMQIVSSNAILIAGLLRRDGIDVVDLGICPDRIEPTRAAMASARDGGFDVLVTSGGASVGDHDLVRKALVELGVDLSFWKIAMRPGKPMMMGRLGPLRVLGLPGNPVASFVCAELFLKPLVRRLAGRTDIGPAVEDAILGTDMAANDHRADHVRASLASHDGRLIATPNPVQDSSMLHVLAEADALVLRAAHAPEAAKGDACRIMRLPR